MYCVSLYKMTAINLMCSELPIGVDNLGAVPTAVQKGCVPVVALNMVKNVSLQLGHLATQYALPLLDCPIHHHGHVDQEHVVHLLGGGVGLSCS